MRRTTVYALCLFLPSSIALAQQRNLDITQIMSYFVVSQVAAEKCLKPTEDEMLKFAHNLLVVESRTRQVIKERSLGKSDELLNSEFSSVYSSVKNRYTEALEKAGCDSTLGQEGTNLWKANANWVAPF